MKNTFTKLISRLLLILCLLFTGRHGFAQYTVTTIATGEAYSALAKDQSNNIYVVRYNTTNNNYEVARFLGGDPAVSSVIYSGLSYDPGGYAYPWGIAVNAGGDVFVLNSAITNKGEIIKLTYPSYSATVIHSGNYYSAITTDAADNLLTLEYNSTYDTYQIVKYAAGAESNPGTVIYNGLANPADATSPWGIVTNSNNDIFFLGFMSPDGGEINKLTYPAYTKTTLATNRAFSSLAIDASNNLYTSEALDNTTSQVVKYTDPSQTGEVLYSGLTRNSNTFPWGLAVNSSGQLFVNDAAAAGSGRIIRLDPPTSLVSSITRINTSPTAASTVRYTVVFNRAVTGINTLAFSLTSSGGITGASVISVSGSGTTYTVSLNTGTGDGTLRLNVTGTGIVPTTTNVPYTSGPTYTIDKTKPTGSIVINSGSTITGNTTVTLTTAVTDATSILMRFSNDGTAYSAYEAFATSKSWALSAGDGLKTVYVQYLDAAGNSQTYSSTITLDQTAPETNITSGPADPNNSSSANFAFTSSEAGSTFQFSIDGSAYAGCVSPFNINGLAAGSHNFSVRAIDQAGNIDATPATYTWTIDLTAPVVTSVEVPAAGYYVIGSSLRFKVNFNENVQVGTVGGIPYLDVTLASGAVKAYPTAVTNNVVTFTYVVVNGDAEPVGPVLGATLKTNGGYVRDLAGNDANPALQSIASTNGVIVNTVKPTAVMTTTQPSLVNHSLTATVTFSEAVYTLTKFSFITTNTTINSVTTSDNITFNIAFTPIADGPVQISVLASAVQNVAGNPNQVSNTLSFTYDATKPVVSSVSVPANGYYKAGNAMNFTVNFSEALVKDFTGGNPYLNITVGSSTLAATLTGSTSTSLTFSYTVVDGDQDMDGIAVNGLVLNGSTIKDAAGNDATLTLNSIGSTTNVKVNTTHPSVTLSTALSVVNAPFTTTITFSEAVTGFVIGDIVAGNATLSNLQTSDNTTFTVLVTPTAEATVTLNVAADVAQNIGLNGNTYAAQLNVLYDITPPVVSAVSVPANAYYVAGNNMDFTVTFDGPINMSFAGSTPFVNITIGSSIVQAALISSTTSSLTFRYTVVNGDQDMNGITVGSLDLNGHTIKDAADNDAILTLNNVGNTSGVFVNTTHPSVVVSTAAPARVNAAYTATITFSEAVTGFIATDITTTNASLSNLQTIDNITYTVLVTPTANGDVSLTVAANVAVNIANNGNDASNTIHVMYDITVPAIVTVGIPANGYYKLGSTMNFTVNYSENVLVDVTGGTPYIYVVLATSTVHATYVSGSGTSALTFSYAVQSGDLDMDGPGLGTNLQTNGGTIRDVATNDADVTLQNVGNLTAVFVNGIRPSVVVSTAAPALVNQAITASITFSEAVTGLVIGDFVTTNATLSNLQTSDNITYTVLVTPTADGAVNISVPAAAQNIAGNDNTASNTLSFTYDITAPLVTSVAVPADGYYKAATTPGFTVNFDGNIILNTTGGTPYINVTIGSSIVQAVCTGTSGSAALTFSYTVQNGDQDMDGITVGSLVLNGGTIKDAATNNAVLTLNNTGSTTGVFVNTAHPSVVVSTSAAAIVNAPFTATITFNEAVTGFAIGDIVASNATLSNLQTSDNITYTVLLTPTTEGTVTVSVPANAAVNIGDNGNTVSNTLSVTYDITAPVVNLVMVPGIHYYKAGNNLGFTVQFNENILLNATGGNPYLNITIGSTVVQASYVGTAGLRLLNFVYTIQNGDMDMDGITVGSLVLNGSTIKDVATNNAVLTLNNIGSTTGVFVNTSHPSVALSTTVAIGTVNAAFTAMITFSEAVTGFVQGDIVVSNATLSNLQTTDNIKYTVLVTPIADGAVMMSVPPAVAVNIGDNDNTASPASLVITYDVTAPVVTSVAVPANGYYKAANTLSFIVNYNENVVVNPVTGVPYINVVLATGTVKATYTGGSGTSALVFSYPVQPGDMDMDGIAVSSLVLNGGTIKDIATNNAVLTLNNVAVTTGVMVNTATPSVVLSTTAAARINTIFDVKIVFSETVTGMTAADLNVTNGTAANLQTTDNITYTATITPTSDGTVSVSLPAGQAMNVVTNTNSVSNTVSLVYDITAPVITAGLSFNTSERSPVGTLIGAVTAIETAGTLQNWTITGDDSGGAFSIDNTGKITVKNVAILNSNANTTVHLILTVSDGLNTSTGESVAITIKFVNQAPTLDTIASTVMCTNTDIQTIQLSGASSVETDQTYSFSIMANQPYFDALSVSSTGLVTYQLKAGTTGIATITVTIKDDGGTSNGGVDSLRRTFTITANSLPVVSISSDKGNTISKGDIIHLTATGGNSYSWDVADGNISGEGSDILEARPMDNTTYKVTVSSAAGCKDSATITVNVVEDFKVDAINVMSPNGDGVNDKWVIRNLDSYPNNEVKIFDRTGRMVYSRRNYANEWDATMNGSPLSEGTYYYILTFDGGKTAKGYITIIRDRK